MKESDHTTTIRKLQSMQFLNNQWEHGGTNLLVPGYPQFSYLAALVL